MIFQRETVKKKTVITRTTEIKSVQVLCLNLNFEEFQKKRLCSSHLLGLNSSSKRGCS